MNKSQVLGMALGGASVAALIWLYVSIRWMLLIPVALLIFLVLTPLMMRNGKDLVVHERTKLLTRIGADLPAEYNKKNVWLGFFLMLAFLWLAPAATTLIPGGALFIAAYIPVLLICVFGEVAISKMWRDFRFSVKKYWIMNISITLVLSAVFFGVRLIAGYS